MQKMDVISFSSQLLYWYELDPDLEVLLELGEIENLLRTSVDSAYRSVVFVSCLCLPGVCCRRMCDYLINYQSVLCFFVYGYHNLGQNYLNTLSYVAYKFTA